MRQILSLSFLLLPLFLLAQNEYFFPKGENFDAAIPSPQDFLGYAVGDYHTRHDRMVSYMEQLASLSDKATLQTIGYTNEMRPQIVLTISSPENHQNLERIRLEHLRLADAGADAQPDKVVVLLGYNVHGNEPSSTEAAMLTAYYLIANQSQETRRFLQEAVVHIDPSYNPDGRDRHSHWANMHRSDPLVADPDDAEHNESWPRGRTNHYWFDLNRDWLPLAQVESRNRMAFYHRWLPNVATDYHEMGTNATYFFEPTEPFGSENPIIPRANYDRLNVVFAKYFEEALNEIGSLYYTKESFDNSYPGYGSTYPDIQGGLGLVFEQASSRGHLQDTRTKPITFAFTIRNHLRTSIATVRAAVENKKLMNDHMRDFFRSAIEEAGKRTREKAIVFGDPDDGSRTRALARLLALHHIDTYILEEDLTMEDQAFPAGEAYVVPLAQEQYRLISSIFDPVLSFYDSVFYDASSWTVALAYNMPYQSTASLPVMSPAPVTVGSLSAGSRSITPASYAYLIDWRDYQAPEVLYGLLDKGVYVKTAFFPFSMETDQGLQEFSYGTLLVAVTDQKYTPAELHDLIESVLGDTEVPVFAISTGFSSRGIDLGSNNFRVVEKPKVAMLIGDGTSGYETGEIWHLLDTKVDMPVTKVYTHDFNQLDLSNYNTLVLASGNYQMLGEDGAEKIKRWTQQGGTLIAMRSAVSWAIRAGLSKEQLIKDEDEDEEKEEEAEPAPRRDFVHAREDQGSRATGGSIYMADLDITHPLGFGYSRRSLPVYRNHNIFLEPSKNPYATVVQYEAEPLLGGYVHPDNLEKIANSASLVVSPQGRGRVILFVDNPNFRGFWYGTNKLFFNALFFGSLTYVP